MLARLALLGICAALAAACSGDSGGERIRRGSATLRVPGLTPVPCTQPAPTTQWQGGIVDLLLADALTECLVDSDGEFIESSVASDRALERIEFMMSIAAPLLFECAKKPHLPVCTSGQDPRFSTFVRWRDLRADPDFNCDPTTFSPGRTVGLDLSGGVVEHIRPTIGGDPQSTIFKRTVAANGDLRTAGVNLCLAQTLRQRAPGTTGGEMLFLSDADQRQLLQTIRERAQLAMLQYSLLGSVFSFPFVGSPPDPNVDPEARIQDLQYWALQCGLENEAEAPGCGIGEDRLGQMGRDFATAVQLHVRVSEEEAQLLARSRSARIQTDGPAEKTRADENWGANSWYQRLLAGMYGGDPLAVENTGLWIHPLRQTTPGTTGTRVNGAHHGWWSHADNPYVTNDISDPRIELLAGLALTSPRNRLRLVVRATQEPGECEAFDLEASATNLYDWVETELRVATCGHLDDPTPATCPTEADLATVFAQVQALPFPGVAGDRFILWDRYRVAPEHADQLVRYLADLTDFSETAPFLAGCNPSTPNENAYLSSKYAIGNIAVTNDPDSPTSLSLFLDGVGAATAQERNVASAGIHFADKPLRAIATKYTQKSRFRMPVALEILPGHRSDQQGFAPLTCYPSCLADNTDAKRLMGAVSALTATRHAVMENMAFLQNEGSFTQQSLRLDDYFLLGEEIVRTINGAIGLSSVTVKPLVTGSTTSTDVEVVETADGKPIYFVDSTFDGEDDGFWFPSAPGIPFFIVAFSNAHADNLVVHPESTVLGFTLPSQVTFEAGSGNFGIAATSALTRDEAYGAVPRRWGGFVPFEHTRTRTLAAVRFDDTLPAEFPFELRLLGAKYRMGTSPLGGQYIAEGGSLGAFIKKQTQTQARNPTVPAYDGFGLRTDLVPPLSAELVGGEPGATSASFYIEKARVAAQDATAAVETAVDGQLLEETDEVALVTSAAESQSLIEDARETLCGGANPECQIDFVSNANPQAEWYSNAPPVPQPPGVCDDISLVPAGPNNINRLSVGLECVTHRMFEQLLEMEVDIAKPVLDAINDPAAPSFNEFAGGKLQSVLIAQWGALKAPDEILAALNRARDVATQEMEQAQDALEIVEERAKQECSAGTFLNSVVSGFPLSVGSSSEQKDTTQPNGTTTTQHTSTTGGSAGLGFNPAGFFAQSGECKSARFAVNKAAKEVLRQQDDAFGQVVSAMVGMTDAQVAIQSSSADIRTLITEKDLAVDSAILEEELAARSIATSFGLVRRYRSGDLWRAKALLENARRFGVIARRAIEARFVVDLDELTAEEPFVSSPATWAGDVYRYDLSLPSSVGLVTGEAIPGAVYSNQVTDYVTNLDAFVTGFTVERPSAVAAEDIDVVTLRGLLPGEVDSLPGETEVFIRNSSPWLLLCPDELWRFMPSDTPASQVCGKSCSACGCEPACDSSCLDSCDIYEQPTRAKLRFSLDPWGRLNSFIADEPFERRYNGRWGPVAVNFVGTGIKDCTQAEDPLGCYNEAFIRYSLSHVGPAWITDFGELWRAQGVPIGRIEGAKGLAAELWLDPLKDGWDSTYINAVSRTEFALRPLGGSYELEFEVAPEVVLDRIERLQVLVGSTYWVKQD